MVKPKIIILRTAGTNCDKETKFAFDLAGGKAELVHINEIASSRIDLSSYQILAIPGGFSYGDDVAAGKILANELTFKLKEQITKFIKQGKLIIGICNGFQVLVKAGILSVDSLFKQDISLINNDSGKFEDRWTYLKAQNKKCVWARDLPEVVYFPVAHGEGKFFLPDHSILDDGRMGKLMPVRYVDDTNDITQEYPFNPNGSRMGVAGICSEDGRHLAMMPHPERAFLPWQCHWIPEDMKKDLVVSPWIKMFQNAREWCETN